MNRGNDHRCKYTVGEAWASMEPRFMNRGNAREDLTAEFARIRLQWSRGS